jgi:hypothetical protein
MSILELRGHLLTVWVSMEDEASLARVYGSWLHSQIFARLTMIGKE